MQFMRYEGFSILSPWYYYQKLIFLKNFTRYITPWLKSRVLDLCAMVIKSRTFTGVKRSKNSNLLSEFKKNNPLKSYNFGEKGLGTQYPRGIFPLKNKISKFCKLIRNLFVKSFKISRRSLSV